MVASSTFRQLVAAISRRMKGSNSKERSRRARRKDGRRFRPALELLEGRVTPTNSLGTYALLEGSASGTDSDIVATTGAWTAAVNNPSTTTWLHTTSTGTGTGLATFTFDANSGATRTGTLTIAGQTLTVTQAGTGYVAGNPAIDLPYKTYSGLALDGAGNLYSNDWSLSTITGVNLATGQTIPQFSFNNGSNAGIAADRAGNVYAPYAFIDSSGTTHYYIGQWNFNTETGSNLAELNSTGTGIAVDNLGNVYFADVGGDLQEWCLTTKSVTTLDSGLKSPEGVAVDAAGNVYVAEDSDTQGAIIEWNATSRTASTLISGIQPVGLAVDGSGNVFFSVSQVIGNNGSQIEEYHAASGTIETLFQLDSGYSANWVALDETGNVYFTAINDPSGYYSYNSYPSGDDYSIEEIVRAYVPPGVVTGAPAGDGQLQVLPTSELLTGSFAPTSSDTSWLTIGNTSNGVVQFSFTKNTTGTIRSAQITVLGQSITVSQEPSALGTSSLVEGPASGADSVLVGSPGPWTASSGDPSWLQTTSTGTGNGLATFTFDANTGPTRTGTLTIAGLTMTVTQAGTGYVPANPFSLVSSGLSAPYGVAVDSAGNVYFADTGNNAIKEWNATTQQVTTLVSSGLNSPWGVAVDSAGNVYIADTNNNAIEKWNATSGLTTLVSSGLNLPYGLAVDSTGNVYIADTGDSAIKEWSPTSPGTLTTLVSSGLNNPYGVAVDSLGNVYIADTMDNAIKEWSPSSGLVTTLVSSWLGLNEPQGLTVDGSGNVYIADTHDNMIKEWSPATKTVSTLVSSGLNQPWGLAVDSAGALYIGDTFHQAVKVFPRAFLSSSSFTERSTAGSDQLGVLTNSQLLTGVFPPTSNQSWLTLGTTSNGVIPFSFTQNTTFAARSAQISVLGQQVTVTQAGQTLGTNSLLEGPAAGSDSDLVLYSESWQASSNASWLTLTSSTSGTGNDLVTFSFTANTGATPPAP